MQRRSVQIDVQQEITYYQQVEKDLFEHQGAGLLTCLTYYTKLSYQDAQGVDIEIKWGQVSRHEARPYVEIKQPHTKMRFEEGVSTYAAYPTPQGTMPLEIKTEKLLVQEDSLELVYSIQAHDHRLADYHFRLHYS